MEWISPRRPRSISIGIPQDSEVSIDILSPVIHLEYVVTFQYETYESCNKSRHFIIN